MVLPPRIRVSLLSVLIFRERSLNIVRSTLLATHPPASYPDLPENMLSILERLDTFPSEPSELNAWWVESLGATPPKPKGKGKSALPEDDDDDEPSAGTDDNAAANDDDDWRKFFDDPKPVDENTKNKPAHRRTRLHALTTHQALHNLPSHRAVFTRAWLALLPRLRVENGERARALSVRALNVMHRGVLPHLTRAVLAMDWLAECVDYGKIIIDIVV
jgi:U3 small nucleolar RNA-associated protein 19